MIYILGASGFLGKKVSKLFNKKEKILMSIKKKKNSIKTYIFTNYKKKEKWLQNLKANDILLILSSPGKGKIEYYEKFKNKIKLFEKAIARNLISKINKEAKVVFLSTDMVYGNRKTPNYERSVAKPINEYGRSKKRIEDILKKRKNHIILRLSKIYSNDLKEKTFLSNTILNLKKKRNVYLFTDQYVHFMEIKEFLKIFKKIIVNINNLNGIYNLPGKIFDNRYNFIKKKLKEKNINFNPSNLKKISLKNKNLFLPLRLKMKSRFKF